jgi:hypothetical protein
VHLGADLTASDNEEDTFHDAISSVADEDQPAVLTMVAAPSPPTQRRTPRSSLPRGTSVPSISATKSASRVRIRPPILSPAPFVVSSEVDIRDAVRPSPTRPYK